MESSSTWASLVNAVISSTKLQIVVLLTVLALLLACHFLPDLPIESGYRTAAVGAGVFALVALVVGRAQLWSERVRSSRNAAQKTEGFAATGHWSNVHIRLEIETPEQAKFKRKIRIWLTNRAGVPVTIVPAGVVVNGALQPDRQAERIPGTERFVTKFYDRTANSHELESVYLRPNDQVDTWVGLDPKYTRDEIDAALSKKAVCTLHFFCVWADPLPRPESVTASI